MWGWLRRDMEPEDRKLLVITLLALLGLAILVVLVLVQVSH